MKKNNIIILSLLFILIIGIVGFNYTNQLVALFVEAAAPNPGHSLSEIEGGADLATETYVDNAVSGISGSNWTVSGTDIYRSDGNVGIGTTTPSAKLHVNGNIIAADPTEDNHVVTKAYVDVLWPPQGCNPGDPLIMGDNGVYCNAPLTWPGSTKSSWDCDSIGGSVYDTGVTGTICRYPGSTIPAGWTQADNWQRYSPASWGGDACGRHVSYGPASFSDAPAAEYWKSSTTTWAYSYCDDNADLWANRLTSTGTAFNRVGSRANPTTNRAEVGIY